MTPRLLALFAAVILLAACSPSAAVEPTDEAPVSQPPVFSLVPTNGRAIPGEVGSWCWERTCVDLDAPPHIDNFLTMPDNRLVIRAQPPASNRYTLTLTMPDSGEVAAETVLVPDGDSLEWTPEVAGGDYILSVHAAWPDGGDVTYYFGVSMPETVPTEEASARPPDLMLILPDGTEQIGHLGTYCWTDPAAGVGLCADAAWPPPFEPEFDFPLGSPFEFRFAHTPAVTLTVQLLDANAVEAAAAPVEPIMQTEIEVSAEGTASWTPDGLAAGRYLLVVFAVWRNEGENTIQAGGDAFYSFVVNVK